MRAWCFWVAATVCVAMVLIIVLATGGPLRSVLATGRSLRSATSG